MFVIATTTCALWQPFVGESNNSAALREINHLTCRLVRLTIGFTSYVAAGEGKGLDVATLR